MPPQIPLIKIKEQSQITEKDPNNACSMRKHPIPKIIITPPDDTGTTQKEINSESNKKDEIWIELEDMSPQKKKFTDKSYDITPKTKKPQQQRRQRMKMEKSQFKCTVILKML